MPIRVAIFDDNKNLLNSLFHLVNGTPGFECVGAFPNCNELISDIKKSNPDVVLMDIEMPGISGIEAVLVIKEKYPSVKVLMETIFEDDEKVFATICNGADGYILKNTPPSEILDSRFGQRWLSFGGILESNLAGSDPEIASDHESQNAASHNEAPPVPFKIETGGAISFIGGECFVQLADFAVRII